MKRWLVRLFLLGAGTFLTVVFAGYREATRDPVIVNYRIASHSLPASFAPLRIVLLSDTHVAGPDMPPSRLASIVARVNALTPDLVVLTGDYVSDKFVGHAYTTAAAIAPLARLRARYGVFAVPGNHDLWRNIGATRAAFERAAIPLLFNDSRVAGPVTVAGVDDAYAGDADVAAALASAEKTRPIILLSHSPDIFPQVPSRVALTLAGHTHGGQIVLPGVGALATASSYGQRYVRGLIVEGGRPLVVTSGLGTSIVPLRFGRPPEIVVVTLSAAR